MEDKKNGNIIYCISGLGADGEIFNGFPGKDFLLRYLPWVEPGEKETLAEYAKGMSASITDPEPVILGVSFGGMIAIEIAKIRKVKKLILISVAKTKDELPLWMKVSGALNLHKLLPVKSIKLTKRIDDRRLGISNEEEESIVSAYRKSGSSHMLNWGIDKVLKWRNKYVPDNHIHIHGSDDRVFPLRNITATHVIRGGTHIMMLNRKNEIAEILSGI